MRSSAPRPDRSFADPSGNILGSKLCIGATIRSKFVSFILFVVLSFPIVILFFYIFILIHFS